MFSGNIPSLAALVIAMAALAGCSTTTRVRSAEREEGRMTSLDWRIGDKIAASRCELDAAGKPVPTLAQNDAVAIANRALPDLVKTPGQWSLADCRLIRFQKDCYGWSVRFDRKGVFEDAQASDRFVKLYVLFDKSVLVPTVSYDRQVDSPKE